ncbi:VOC family protein [Streptosporangium sp. NPDC049644]|uniref:VOC family protein n=1 Tax=Streptosporangium sp. NPDC049644 TaxID=3155507 RepID=UPI00342F769A
MHHLKIWVSGLARSRSWYERVLGLEHHTGFEDEEVHATQVGPGGVYRNAGQCSGLQAGEEFNDQDRPQASPPGGA